MAEAMDILLSRLDGLAGRHAEEGTAREIAVDDLRSLTTDPRVLGKASGLALGAWRADHIAAPWGRAKSRLLDEAGADPDIRDAVADATLLRLARMREGRSPE